jgi:hypothetical protein
MTAATSATAASDPGELGRRFAARIDPGIPESVAVRFGRAAVDAGLTPAEAARMLNDDRFRMAVSSAGQGFEPLEALTHDPAAIRSALELVRDRGFTVAGADSLQNAILGISLDLKNAYLRGLGRMAVLTDDGRLVLVDIETGREVRGHDMLGALIRAPGGGPLPSPSPIPSPSISRTIELPEPPGGGIEVAIPQRHWTDLQPGLLLVIGLFGIAWIGFALVLVGRRLHRER